jgi:heat shock protein HslJ
MKGQSMTHLRVVVSLGLALGMTACAGSTSSPTGPAAPGGANGTEAGQGNLALVGSWEAVSVQPAGASAVVVEEPPRFTAEFRADGTLALRADCNRCACGYTAGAGSLTTTPMACTLAACPSAPLDTQFAGLVGGATSWTVAGDRLDLASTAGVVHMRR